MNTSNTFLRFFQEGEYGEELNETFVSIVDVLISGVPIDTETGDDFDDDVYLYFHKGQGQYEKIA